MKYIFFFNSGFSTAWPLLTVGLGALTIVAIVTIFMILTYVILPKRRNRKLI
jgi:uncharacterized BrkB/YihY/UPF0761 family membrane protein